MISNTHVCSKPRPSNYKQLCNQISPYSRSGEIPVELGDLSALVSLWLNDNMLSGLIPQALGRLTALESLWLKHNKGLKCEYSVLYIACPPNGGGGEDGSPSS